MPYFKKKEKVSCQKIVACLECTQPYNPYPADKKCTRRFCNGSLYQFDSTMEFLRYKDLKSMRHISDLSVQKVFKYGMYQAIYDFGKITERPPIFKGYSKKVIERAEYTADFFYNDGTTPFGWVVEEFKPVIEKVDQNTKSRFNLAYDQHSMIGEFCYSYPEKNVEIVNGKEQDRSYKRIFITRTEKGHVREKDFNTMFDRKVC